jgi:hypothetical protein
MDRQAAAVANVMRSDIESTDLQKNKLDTGFSEYDNKPNAMVMDMSLSDFYYVKSIRYGYVDGKFETSLILSRRHWLLPLAKNEIKT